MNLSEVSKTAIYILICHTTQTEKGNTDFKDLMAD